LDKDAGRIAFQIAVNGKPYCESEDITAFTMVVEQVRRGDSRISLHASAGESPLQWLSANFSIGDEVTVRIIDAADLVDQEPRVCNFCGRNAHDVRSMVQGGSVTICDGCINGLGGALKSGTPLPLGALIREETEWTCGFCRKAPGEIPGVIVRNGAAICPECLRACADILTDSPDRDTLR
jgi:hypothetical protein